MTVLQRCVRAALAPAEIWYGIWQWLGEQDTRHDAVGTACTWALRAIWASVTLVLVPLLLVTT